LLTALFFPLYQPVNAGTGEIPLALSFLLLGTAFLDSLQPRQENAPLVRLALASLYCAATKQEGAFFVAVLAAFLAITSVRRQPKKVLKSELALLLPVAAHTTLLRVMRGPVIRRDFDLSLLRPAHWPEWWHRVLETISYTIRYEVPKAAVPIAAILVLFLIARPGHADALLGPLITQAGAYMIMMSLSAFGVAWLIEASFGRLIDTLFPLLLLVAVARLRLPLRLGDDNTDAIREPA
jgi:hypothetical protein